MAFRQVVGRMEEVNQAAQAAGGSVIALDKLSTFLFFLKKHAAIVLPAAAVMACCIVVMAMTKPPTFRETIVALIVTAVFAICGAEAVGLYFSFNFPDTTSGRLAHNGLIFICGMPGWVLVRACFNWSDVNKKKTIVDLVKQIKAVWQQ